MVTTALHGKKIAVIVESEYIPEEINIYRNRFADHGATVDLVSMLWGQKKATFLSAIDPLDADALQQTPKPLEVFIDVAEVDLDDYAAVVMAANYTSVRLRDFTPPNGSDGKPLPITPDMVRRSPVVQFFGRAMRDPRIVKGALCHGLWILTPTPELLAGRKVICHEVVLADIVNAGGIFTPDPSNVVVDGDLVTGHSKAEAGELVDRITELIVARAGARQDAPEAAPARAGGGGKKRILTVVSNHGYWGEELVGPLDAFEEAGYEFEIATPTGERPRALPPSMDESYVDPPLGRPVTSPEMARKVREIDDVGPSRGERSRCLDHPLDLSALLPERPYFSHPVLVRGLEAYYRARDAALRSFDRFDALLLVGGSGPIVDMVNNQRVHDLILGFIRVGKPVAAECYGVACLAFARDFEDRRSILRNKHVTGHCLEYDYKDGTGFLGTDFNMGPPPYPLELILRDATAPEGQYHGNFGKETSVIVDYPFITGRSTPDSTLTGRKLVEVLDHGLLRWGW